MHCLYFINIYYTKPASFDPSVLSHCWLGVGHRNCIWPTFFGRNIPEYFWKVGQWNKIQWW